MLFTESENDLQKFLHRFITTASVFNMNISIKKAQTMIAKEPIRCSSE